MDRLAHLVLTRARFVLLAAVALVAVSAAWGLGVFGHLDQGGFDDQATDSARELAQERALFGNRDVDVVAIYRSARHQVDDPAFRREVEQTLAGIPAGTTTHVTTWWQTHDPSLVSSDRHATQVLVSLAGDDQAALSDNDDRVVPALRASDLQTQIAGQWAVYRDVNTTVSADLARAESAHKVKNVSNAPIVGLRIDEYFYVGQKEASVGVGKLRTALAPGEIAEITTEGPLAMGITGSQLQFSQANGQVKPTVVKKFTDDKAAPAKK